MASKPEETRYCCYTKCEDRKSLDGRIEVKTVLPTHGLKKLKSPFLVRWKQNGEAEFHMDCWDKVFDLSRQRTKTSIEGGICKEEKALVEAAAEAPEQFDDVKDMTKANIEGGMSKEEKALVKAAAEAPEQFDDVKDILDKAKVASEWIKQAKNCVAFTGAGISTSAGIGDYRGKAGKWTEEDQNGINMDQLFEGTSTQRTQESVNQSDREPEGEVNQDEEDEDGVPYEKLRPTYTHEALNKLMESNYLKYIISQNGDGLHGLSGIKPDKIAELHGNVFREYCEKCGENYDRKFYVMDDIGSQYFEEREDFGRSSVKKPRHAKKCDLCGLSHRTGRKCEKKGCNGFLLDTIINFRDLLDEYLLDNATEHSEQCDVMLCLGTTLQVTPACDLVRKMKVKDKIIICNRQETPMDHHFSKKTKDGRKRGCRVFGDCDLFIREMMKHIYPEQELLEWENRRGERLKQYDLNRD